MFSVILIILFVLLTIKVNDYIKVTKHLSQCIETLEAEWKASKNKLEKASLDLSDAVPPEVASEENHAERDYKSPKSFPIEASSDPFDPPMGSIQDTEMKTVHTPSQTSSCSMPQAPETSASQIVPQFEAAGSGFSPLKGEFNGALQQESDEALKPGAEQGAEAEAKPSGAEMSTTENAVGLFLQEFVTGPFIWFFEYFLKTYRHFKAQNKLTEFFLTISGITVMLFGFAYLFQYSFSNYFGVAAKVGFGFVSALGLIVTGQVIIKKRYNLKITPQA